MKLYCVVSGDYYGCTDRAYLSGVFDNKEQAEALVNFVKNEHNRELNIIETVVNNPIFDHDNGDIPILGVRIV